MAYNKVEADGKTLIDLTSDTVTADTLVSGRTAHLASGAQVTGTFEPVTGVKGNAESTYRKGNVNLTPANIGAATSAQGEKADSAVQTIQIGGTAQTKTSGTVNLPAYPTKSSLGLENVDNTSDANKPVSTAQQTALNGKVAKAGDTMTGELRTSFGCVANGSIVIESKVGGFPVTLPNFIDAIRYSSGCSGSAQFSAYTLDDITIPSGWYNFEWLPHRTGGVNGATSGDNCNFGSLILTGMTVANKGYIVKYSNQAITEVHELYKGEELEAQVNYNSNQGVKNLLYTKPASATWGGVTATCTSPNKYNISGTTTKINRTTLLFTNLSTGDINTDSQYPSGNPFGTGNFILSGKVPEGISFQILIAKSLPLTTSNYRSIAISAYAPSQPITLDSTDKYVWFRLAYNVSATTTYNNDEAEIMMRRAEIEDDTFEPYAESNYQLTQKADKALEQTGYNLLEITADTQTINGVTFTVDKSAGTITANGTATSTIWNLILLSSKVFTENVVVSGCPTGGNYSNTYSIQTDAVDGTTYYDFGSGFTFPQGKSMTLRIVIRSGYTCNNLVFKPMIVPAELAGMPFQPYAMSNVQLTQKALLKEDDNAGGYVVDFDKDCKLQRNANYIYLRNNSINIHTDSSNISLQCGTTGSPLRGVQITNTAVRMYFGLNTLTVDEDGLWFNDTKIAE